ncbi:MAG: hypothetical protein ACWA6U_13715 [Breznakibacter sp.]
MNQVHVVNIVLHYYDFHADWRFPEQYLNGGKDKHEKSWSCIYNSDLSNVNLLFLFNCDGRVPCVEKYLHAMMNFLKTDGSIMVLSEGNSRSRIRLLNDMELNSRRECYLFRKIGTTIYLA